MSGDRFNNPTDYGQDAFLPQVDVGPVLREGVEPGTRLRISDAELAHMYAMTAKRAIFSAQDAASCACGREQASPTELKLLRKFEKRLAKIRAELEALDRDYLNRKLKR